MNRIEWKCVVSQAIVRYIARSYQRSCLHFLKFNVTIFLWKYLFCLILLCSKLFQNLGPWVNHFLMLKDSLGGEIRWSIVRMVYLCSWCLRLSWKWHSSWGFDSLSSLAFLVGWLRKAGTWAGAVDQSTCTLPCAWGFLSACAWGFLSASRLRSSWTCSWLQKPVSVPRNRCGVTSATFCWLQVSSKIPEEGTYTIFVVVVILTLVLSD